MSYPSPAEEEMARAGCRMGLTLLAVVLGAAVVLALAVVVVVA